MKITASVLRIVAVALTTTLCDASDHTPFNPLYDYYFPKEGRGVMSSVYRKAFDKLLFTTVKPVDSSDRQFYDAFYGDPRAFDRFIHSGRRAIAGAQGEEWVYECVLLLLQLGDQRFAALLGREDVQTREAVGAAIDPHIDWTKHRFDRTRALYSYRYSHR
jgi:hypothetical protein